MRLLPIAAGCAALLSSLAVTACKKAPPASDGDRNQMFIVEVVTVAPQPFRETLFATGTLLPNESVTLQSERSGLVTEIHFEEGKPVKAGAKSQMPKVAGFLSSRSSCSSWPSWDEVW
jgi:multidrug efflux pump subunit AcrA (membrane-fusion protein)